MSNPCRLDDTTQNKVAYAMGFEDGRADAERDFQNSDYWNDYLAKVIADAKADAIEEFANKLIDELHYNVSAKPVTINTPYATPIMIYGEIQKIAEQLKEQK